MLSYDGFKPSSSGGYLTDRKCASESNNFEC